MKYGFGREESSGGTVKECGKKLTGLLLLYAQFFGYWFLSCRIGNTGVVWMRVGRGSDGRVQRRSGSEHNLGPG